MGRKKESPDVIKNRIVDILRNSDGMTIKEISQKLTLHHITASKYLAVLEAEKRVFYKQIGMAKLFKVSTEGAKVK